MMWVVKLGGSLLSTPELQCWVDFLVKHSARQVIIVPGGGVFADAVRVAQKACHFDDKTAHQMALLAMDQYGLLLASLNPALVTASSDQEIATYSAQKRTIIWLPSRMLSDLNDIVESWTITSDSLAAWLAAKLNVEHLLLVKSCQLPRQKEGVISVKSLIENNVVDACFSEYIAHQNFETSIMHKSQFNMIESGLSAGIYVAPT